MTTPPMALALLWGLAIAFGGAVWLAWSTARRAKAQRMASAARQAELEQRLVEQRAAFDRAEVARAAAEAELRASEQRYVAALRGSQDGLWEWDIASGRVQLSPRWKSMLGFEANELSDDLAGWRSRVHADDREALENALAQHLAQPAGAGESRFDHEMRLLHKDGQQEGVKGGYTKQGIKPCLHPLLAVLAEVRLVAQLWLRPGNASCGNNSTAFFLDLWEHLPRHIRLKGVRADSGFCRPELLALWEQLKLPYVVVAKLSEPIQKLIKGDLQWTATEVPGTEVAELEYQAMSWPHPRRLVLLLTSCSARCRALAVASPSIFILSSFIFV